MEGQNLTNFDLRKQANLRCTELLHRTINSSATITSALDLPTVFPALRATVLSKHVSGFSPMRGLFRQMSQRDVLEKNFQMIAEGLANQAAVNAENIISAAVVILAHSTADDVFTGSCEIAIDLDSDKWRPELNLKRPVTLEDVNNLGVEKLFARELERFKKNLGAKSLPNRADMLFRRVPIQKHKDIPITEDAYYKQSKLVEADNLRHQIVHGTQMPEIPIAKAHATASFLNEAAMTAVRSVSTQYGLPLDMEHLGRLFQKKKTDEKPEGQ